MARESRSHRRVLFPSSLSTNRVHKKDLLGPSPLVSRGGSAGSGTATNSVAASTASSIYDDDFLATLKLGHEHLSAIRGGDELLPPIGRRDGDVLLNNESNEPPDENKPDATMLARVDKLGQLLRKWSDLSLGAAAPTSIPGPHYHAFNLLSTRCKTTLQYSTPCALPPLLLPPPDQQRLLLPLAEDDAQWERWVQGEEVAPPAMTRAEADAQPWFERKRKIVHKHSSSSSSPYSSSWDISNTPMAATATAAATYGSSTDASDAAAAAAAADKSVVS